MGTPYTPLLGEQHRTRRSNPHPSPLPEGEGILLFTLRPFDPLPRIVVHGIPFLFPSLAVRASPALNSPAVFGTGWRTARR